MFQGSTGAGNLGQGPLTSERSSFAWLSAPNVMSSLLFSDQGAMLEPAGVATPPP